MFLIGIILQNNNVAYLSLLIWGLQLRKGIYFLVTHMPFLFSFFPALNSSSLFFTPQNEYLLAEIKSSIL